MSRRFSSSNSRFQRRQMFGPPIVGETFEAELLQHRCPLGRRALPGIERHDAPGDQIISAKSCPASAGGAWLPGWGTTASGAPFPGGWAPDGRPIASSMPAITKLT